MEEAHPDLFALSPRENGGEQVAGFVLGEPRDEEPSLVSHVAFHARPETQRSLVGEDAIVALRDRERRFPIGRELQPIAIDLSVLVELEAARVEVGMRRGLVGGEFVVEVVQFVTV